MITKEQVSHVAKLARLELQEEELAEYQKDLGQVLDYFALLENADTSGVEPMTHGILDQNIAREDMPRRESPSIIFAMMNLIPKMKDGFLKVKTILSFK